MICSQAIAGDLIPPRVRGKYLAPMGAMFGIAAILGPLLGGWLTDWLGWRSIFWFFLPFGAFAWIAVALALTMPRRRVRLSIDWAGLALAGVGATGIVLSRRDAASIGIDPDGLAYLGTAQTANGRVATAGVRLGLVKFGTFTDTNVPARVTEGGLGSSLLGMSYLDRFANIAIAGDTMTLTR